MNKHDQLIDIIADELQQRGYTKIHKNIEYNHRKHKGEIDLYAVKDKYVLLFEMKTNFSTKNFGKAKAQLQRAKKYYFNKDQRVFKFYVCNIEDPYIRWVINK